MRRSKRRRMQMQQQPEIKIVGATVTVQCHVCKGLNSFNMFSGAYQEGRCRRCSSVLK